MRKTVLFCGCLILFFVFASCKSRPSLTEEERNSYLRKIGAAYNVYEWDSVVVWSEELLALGDTLGNYTPLYAEGLAAIGNPEKAINVLDKRLSETPSDYQCIQTKGNIYCMVGDMEHALQCFDDVIAINPYYARPYIYKADLYSASGNIEGAIDNYCRALELFFNNKVYNECLYYSNQILQLSPNNSWGLLFLAATHCCMNNNNEYRKARKDLLKYGGQNAANILDEMIAHNKE